MLSALLKFPVALKGASTYDSARPHAFRAAEIPGCAQGGVHIRIREAAGGKLARAAPQTLRLRLLKIGARVRMSVRRIYFALSSACPEKTAFEAAWKNLAPG